MKHYYAPSTQDVYTTDDDNQVISVRPRIGQEVGLKFVRHYIWPSDNSTLCVLSGEDVAVIRHELGAELEVSSDCIPVVQVEVEEVLFA